MSKAGDPRLVEIMRKTAVSSCNSLRLRLLGFPFDEGTVRNGGRPGAAHGPAAIRERLQNFGSAINPEHDINMLTANMVLEDGGDACGDTLEDAHASMRSLVSTALAEGALPICIGGSNDQSYSNASGWMQANSAAKEGLMINIDAHLDVRPVGNAGIHSGAPFRLMFEQPEPGFVGRLVEFAAQGAQCSQAHAEFVQEQGGEILWLSKLKAEGRSPADSFQLLLGQDTPTFLSFDIDSIRGSDAPGVSCPSVIGLSADDALDIMFRAGQSPDIGLVDISEFNPLVEADRTSRLVAHMIYYFLLGAASRPV